MADDARTDDAVQDAVRAAWPAAMAHWSPFVLLTPPVDDPSGSAVAQIDLATRQVSYNGANIAQHALIDCVPAILCHEVGHHVRWPGTLQVHARMRLLERTLLPFDDYSLLNLFTDLMINHHLGDVHRAELIRVYQAFAGQIHESERWKKDPVFVFYLTLYESLWDLPAGTIVGDIEPTFAGRFPGYRASSDLLVQHLFLMGPNVYTQLLYFLSFAVRYVGPIDGDALESANPADCGPGEPSPADWADALTPTQAEQDAIDRAVKDGWYADKEEKRLKDLSSVEGRIHGLPGSGTADAIQVPEIMAAFYRQQAEIYLFRPPAQRRLGEAIVPTSVEEWDPDHGVRAIDWLSTLSLRGAAYGTVQPLERSLIAEEEGVEVPLWQPRMEIYLDVSGSMPNPCAALNAMTLAAQILSLATVRAGGWVRAAVYSHETVRFWEWCRSELEMSRFLLHYVGGGTAYPFGLLAESLDEAEDKLIRVVITDTDFDDNVAKNKGALALLGRAVSRSTPFVLLQAGAKEQLSTYRGLGVLVVPVSDLADYPRVARELAWSLFPEGRDALV